MIYTRNIQQILGFLRELALESFGDGDFRVVAPCVLSPAEVLERIGATGEDGVAMKAEVVPAALVEVFVSAFDEDFAVCVIVEGPKGEVEKLAIEFEITGVGFEKFFVNESGFVEAALHAEGGSLADER